MKNINHKVYVNDVLLYIANVYDADTLSEADGKIISSATTDLKDLIIELETHPTDSVYIYLSDNPLASWNIFLSYFTLIEAAGGLVQNGKEEYLTIFRRGKWDLPKGKLDYDESPEQAAIREVEEECGITDLKIIKTLPLVFHTYNLKKKEILKKTHWFLMEYKGNEKLRPQTDEDIESAHWMKAKELKSIFFLNTYHSIKDLLDAVIG